MTVTRDSDTSITTSRNGIWRVEYTDAATGEVYVDYYRYEPTDESFPNVNAFKAIVYGEKLTAGVHWNQGQFYFVSDTPGLDVVQPTTYRIYELRAERGPNPNGVMLYAYSEPQNSSFAWISWVWWIVLVGVGSWLLINLGRSLMGRWSRDAS